MGSVGDFLEVGIGLVFSPHRSTVTQEAMTFFCGKGIPINHYIFNIEHLTLPLLR